MEETDFWKRYELLAFKLVNEVQIMNIKEELQGKVKERVDKHQREYILTRTAEADPGRTGRGQYHRLMRKNLKRRRRSLKGAQRK